jgi:hypothetical protein
VDGAGAAGEVVRLRTELQAALGELDELRAHVAPVNRLPCTRGRTA